MYLLTVITSNKLFTTRSSERDLETEGRRGHMELYRSCSFISHIQNDTKKRELLKNPTKIEEIQEKKLLTEIEPLQLDFKRQ